MIFHLDRDIPVSRGPLLDEETPDLTPNEVDIIKAQIRKNSVVIGSYVERLELFVNKEKYPRDANFLQKIRNRLELLMDENDTFRRVLWKHFQTEAVRHSS